MAVVQGVESVKTPPVSVLAGKKLDVVNHQDVRVAILAELHQGAVLNGIDELIGKLLAGKVDDARRF